MHASHRWPATAWLNEQYLIDRPLKPESAYALRRSVAVFETWLKRPAELTDLGDANLSQFLIAVEKFYAPSTLKRMRGDLMGLARHAAESGACQFPRKVRPVKVPRKAPRGIRPEQVARLIECCPKLPPRKNGMHLGNYFAALIGVAWYTGLRRGDLFAFDMRELDDSGIYPVTQNKTGEVVWRWIAPDIVAKLERLDPRRPLRWQGAKRMLYVYFAKLKELAGVTTPGYLHLLRRSAASDVERQQPGAAGPFLGHLTPGMAEKHYIDRSIAYGSEVRPERLRIERQQELF